MKLFNLLLRHITPYYYITYCLTSALSVYGTKRRVKLDGSCLKPDIITYTHGNAVNIYIFYELVGHGSYTDDPALKNSFLQILTSMDILVMELDLIEYQDFHFEAVGLVKA